MRFTAKQGRRGCGWRLALTAAGILVGVLVLWVAIHRVSWLGPALADGARFVFGPSPVAKAQDFAYGIEDRWNRFWRADEPPRAYWDVDVPPEPPVSSTAPIPLSSAATRETPRRFQPVDVGPIEPSSYAQGDGVWVPIAHQACETEPCMFKTLLHPDRQRGWAAVAVAAIDVASTELHLVAGVEEPKATEREAKLVQRPGLVPQRDHASLLGAFNGGFKTEHGALGMQIEGLTFVPAQRWGCTIGRLANESLAIGSHPKMLAHLEEARWWRQAPPCLVEEGSFAAGVQAESNVNWGSTVSGNTIIRRSAIGLDKAASTVFVGIGDATSAGAIARAMHHAGAYTVAQLDVNHSFPKFLIFDGIEKADRPVGRALCPGFLFTERDYVEKPASRDFFYVTKRGMAAFP